MFWLNVKRLTFIPMLNVFLSVAFLIGGAPKDVVGQAPCGKSALGFMRGNASGASMRSQRGGQRGGQA